MNTTRRRLGKKPVSYHTDLPDMVEGTPLEFGSETPKPKGASEETSMDALATPTPKPKRRAKGRMPEHLAAWHAAHPDARKGKRKRRAKVAPVVEKKPLTKIEIVVSQL